MAAYEYCGLARPVIRVDATLHMFSDENRAAEPYFSLNCSIQETPVWNPAGPAVDAAGDLYVVSANGSTFPGAAYDHTNSVLEVSSSGKLLSSFAPTDWAQNNEGDIGLGSQGVALVGTKWAVLGGKSGPVYVLRQGHLGGIGGQVSATNACLSYGGPAVDGNVVYLPCTDGVRAVRVSSAGTLQVLWHASDTVAGSPVVGGPGVGARPDRRSAARPGPGDRADDGAGARRRHQPLRHAGDLRQPRPGAHPHRRALRRDLLSPREPGHGRMITAFQVRGFVVESWAQALARVHGP
jgi:hypothetical protein